MAGRRSRGSGSQFARYLGPILKALRELGGSGKAREVKALVASDLGLSPEEQRKATGSGQSLFANQFHWAKHYLTEGGLVEAPARGVWRLTEKGAASALDPAERAALVREVAQRSKAHGKSGRSPGKEAVAALTEGVPMKRDDEAASPIEPEVSAHVANLLSILAAIRKAEPTTASALRRARNAAAGEIAAKRGVKHHTVMASCWRGLGFQSVEGFDGLVLQWLTSNDQSLRQRLEAHVTPRNREADLAAIAKFFGADRAGADDETDRTPANAEVAGAPAGELRAATGAALGLGMHDQVRIALETAVSNGGEATMRQIIDAVNARLRDRGGILDQQGQASLRNFVNRQAVNQGLLERSADSRRAWRITEKGREWLRDNAQAPGPDGAGDARRVPGGAWQALLASLRGKGLHFTEEFLSNYLLALQTKRFVILSGISGTGKTRLALAVAEHFSPPEMRSIVAVHPDWTDRRGLLGYYSPLLHRYVSTPFLQLVLGARADEQRALGDGREPYPFFVILDEMNLARVEQYFSDFLSCMESGDDLDLHCDPAVTAGETEDGVRLPCRLPIPRNLFFTGTVNVDETTYMFSPKVLDRAFTIELNEVDLAGYSRIVGAGAAPSGPPRLALSGLPETLRSERNPTSDDWREFGSLLNGVLGERVVALNRALEPHQRHFGYRVANEIARFVTLAAAQAGTNEDALDAALDLAILQKVLPKFHGTEQELTHPLGAMFSFAVTGTAGTDHKPETWQPRDGRLAATDGSSASPRFPRTAAKVWRMLDRLRRQGFASYIE